MDPWLIGLFSTLAIFVLVMFGVPVAYTLGILGITGMYMIVGAKGTLGHLGSVPYIMSAQYAWAVCPLFVFIGSLASLAGMTTKSFDAARKWFGRLPGGLAMATTVASGAFAACSGSTVANAAIFTPMALPEMTKRGYDKRLSVGCIAATGTFAAMIPPSITMVIYGVITEEPIGQLLIAGVIPGLLTVVAYLISIYIRIKRNPNLAPETIMNVTWREKFSSLRGSWGILTIFLVMIGGIYAGWFTPSAAGAVGAFVMFVIVFLSRKISAGALKQVFLDIGLVVSSLFIIIIGGSLFGRFWVLSGFIPEVSSWVTGLSLPPMAIVVLFMIMFIILGCFLDPPSMMVITLPLVHPIIKELGYSGIWFGVLMIKATEIAVITPPIGFNAYVVHAAAGGQVELEDVFSGILPFLLVEIVVLAILVAFPQLSLWLPNQMN